MRISVVIPAYNEEALLPKCLQAVLSQTRKADEVIVVDNASADLTADIARKAGCSLLGSAVPGIWPTAAVGYDAAKYDIIARIDADTIVPPNWLARIESHFLENPDLEALTGPGRFYGCNVLLVRIGTILYMRAYFSLVGLAMGHAPVFGSNVAMRTSVWRSVCKQVHSARTDIHDDIDLSFALTTVLLDRKLVVGISARPLLSPVTLPKRYMRGIRSILLHWPEKGPWRRKRYLV